MIEDETASQASSNTRAIADQQRQMNELRNRQGNRSSIKGRSLRGGDQGNLGSNNKKGTKCCK